VRKSARVRGRAIAAWLRRAAPGSGERERAESRSSRERSDVRRRGGSDGLSMRLCPARLRYTPASHLQLAKGTEEADDMLGTTRAQGSRRGCRERERV
jgi:hypothetical protein